jgi:hypothetical protein
LYVRLDTLLASRGEAPCTLPLPAMAIGASTLAKLSYPSSCRTSRQPVLQNESKRKLLSFLLPWKIEQILLVHGFGEKGSNIGHLCTS